MFNKFFDIPLNYFYAELIHLCQIDVLVQSVKILRYCVEQYGY
jgi:hypothetical protein